MLTCSECNKVFGTKAALSNHLVLHRSAAVLARAKQLRKAREEKFPLKEKEEDPVNLLLQKSSLLLNLVKKKRNTEKDTNKLENMENVQHQNESKVTKT